MLTKLCNSLALASSLIKEKITWKRQKSEKKCDFFGHWFSSKCGAQRKNGGKNTTPAKIFDQLFIKIHTLNHF